MTTPVAPEKQNDRIEDDGPPAPDYDDVIAYAKDHGQDPYLGNGEYNPSVIAWAVNALAGEEVS